MPRPELAQYYNANTDDGRAYKHPFRLGEDGKPLTSPSVTTVLKLVDKSALAQWAVNLTIEWAAEHAQELLGRSTEQGVRAGKYRWKDVRDERAEVGTGIHETIEAEHRGLWTFPQLDAEQQQIMAQWRLFNERYEVTPLRSEFTVWNFTFDYAGTADGLWIITDRRTGERHLCVIDIKTSKSTWPEHWMQLSALRNADVLMEKVEDRWVEIDPNDVHGWKDAGVGIVHLRADHNEFITITPEEVRMRYAQFAHYREIWDLNKQIEGLSKFNQAGAF